jgi:hypothetical protein
VSFAAAVVLPEPPAGSVAVGRGRMEISLGERGLWSMRASMPRRWRGRLAFWGVDDPGAVRRSVAIIYYTWSGLPSKLDPMSVFRSGALTGAGKSALSPM